MIYLRLISKRDNNGNPRRLFLVVDDNGDTIDAIGEGSTRRSELWKIHPDAVGGPEIQVPVSEYNQWLRWGEENRSEA